MVRDDAAPGGFRVQALAAAPPDTVRVAFLRIDFLHDRGGTASTGNGQLRPERPGHERGARSTAPPHNRDFYAAHARALERYYDVQSYGRVVLQVDVWPAEQDSAYHLSDMADLGPWAFGNSVYDAAVQHVPRRCSSPPTRSPRARATASRGRSTTAS